MSVAAGAPLTAATLDRCEPCCTVMRDRYQRGWPAHELGGHAHVVTLAKALRRVYTTDAHFAAYVSPYGRRLTSGALDKLDGIALTCIAFDVDCPAVHGTSAAAPDAWRAELRDKLAALSAVHPAPFFYETRGGARIVYTQSEPTVLRTRDDALKWSQSYAYCLAYFERQFGIVADPACADWQRLFRLPHATRDEGGEPESLLTIGDPERVGALEIGFDPAHLAAAERANPKVFRDRRGQDFAPCTDAGEGRFYRMLHARGHIIRSHAGGAFVVRCPNESEHSTGRPGDNSTLLYPPIRGDDTGWIHCMHAHCAGKSACDWLLMFSRAEREAVDRARSA